MKKYRKFATAGVTVLAAVATAHLMQRGSGGTPQMAAVSPAQAGIVATEPMVDSAAPDANPVTVNAQSDVMRPEMMAKPAPVPHDIALIASMEKFTPLDLPASKFPEMPRPPKDALMPTPLPEHGPELQARMAAATPKPKTAEQPIARNEFGLSCGVLLTATTKDAAMVGLTLTDPCRGEETFTLRHGTLAYAARLNHLGTYMADIPALAEQATFSIKFNDGTEATTEVTVPTADDIDRVALFTDGQTGLGIHALEFGAEYEQAGHIWSGNPRDAASATQAGGGFVTVLGDPSLKNAAMAEIYSFPANTKQRDGVVRLSVETEVTAYNCGKDIAGQTMQKDAGHVSAPVTLTLAMPDCDAIGEFLVLKNLLRDLKIASN